MNDPRLPALTRAEQDLVEHYLRVVDFVGRINPAADTGHFDVMRCVLAAQGLLAEARALLVAAETMRERGETEVFPQTLARAMRVLDGERRTARVLLPPE